ncbi:MAG: T9SS type A sorting domain-containing protein [Flavobacteriaceae bacterium]|nr:T9SS type A sorting domain-containing protein [Flavobacteriaceae bacterium]
MKKKFCLLAAFIVINVAAQHTIESQRASDLNATLYAYTEPVKESPSKVSISLQIDSKNEVLKVRSTLPIKALSINNLFGKKLIHKTNTNSLKVSLLPRGVYEIEVKLEGNTFRKRIILQ